jgi:thiol-disulfide isomerase/thioredoxin
MKTAVCSGMILALTVLGAPAVRGGEAWYIEFDEGRAAAVAQGKDMLIDFGGSDWCLPCRWLKERVFSKPEFIERAGRAFVLVDIDRLLREDAKIPADRKDRYEKLQERYGIATFPSVLLTTSDGRPYARTTYREKTETPELYWKHLVPLQERGKRLREALARVDKLNGRPRAEALADGLSEVDARFVPRFFADRVTDLRAADPSDSTGYLAFLDGRRALDDFQAGLDLHKGPIDVAAVQSLIDRSKLRGESLQEVLVLRAAGEVLAGDDRRALNTLAAVLDAQPSRTRFDRGDFVALDAESIAAVRRRIADGEADSGNGVALYYALHRIFEFDMPNPYEVSCGQGFRPSIRVRGEIGERYGRALIRSTEGLSGEARARALAKGLEGTFFGGQGAIREIIRDLIPGLVGKETAKAILPGKYYPRWID